MADSKIDQLVQQRFRILGEMASLTELRPGRLTCRFQRCGKPGCRCKQEGDPGHGPYYILHFESGGRQTTRSIPARWVERTKRQIKNYKRLRELHREPDRGDGPAVRCRIAGPAEAGRRRAAKKESLRGAVLHSLGGGYRSIPGTGHRGQPGSGSLRDLRTTLGAGRGRLGCRAMAFA